MNGFPEFGLAAARSVVDGEDRVTNAAPLAIAPKITGKAAARDGAGVLTITITCSPRVEPGLNVQLLLDDHQLAHGPVAALTDSVGFVTTKIPAGDYLLRLRVDGVDSHYIDRTATPPVFDPTQRLVVP